MTMAMVLEGWGASPYHPLTLCSPCQRKFKFPVSLQCAFLSVGSLHLPCSSLQQSRVLDALKRYLALPIKLGCCLTPVCARQFYCGHSLPVIMNVIKWRRYEGQIRLLDSWLTIVRLCIASPVEPLWFSAFQIKKCIFLCVFGFIYILPVGIKHIC